MEFHEKGIYVENKGILLEWGKPVIQLVKLFDAIVEKREKYFIAYWGKDSLIENSEINLSTKFTQDTLFHKMEFHVDFESKAIEKFEVLNSYFEKSFGQPDNIENDNQDFSDKKRIWKYKNTQVILELEDFRGLKLYLEISNIKGLRQRRMG